MRHVGKLAPRGSRFRLAYSTLQLLKSPSTLVKLLPRLSPGFSLLSRRTMYAARPPASVDVFFDEKAFAFRFVRLIVNGRMRIRCAASHLSRGACSEVHLVVQRLQVLPPLSKCDSGLLSQLTRPQRQVISCAECFRFAGTSLLSAPTNAIARRGVAARLPAQPPSHGACGREDRSYIE